MLFTRRLAGIWGIVSAAILTLLVAGMSILLELPAVISWSFILLAGMFLLLQILSTLRGAAKRPGDVSTFEHNTLGNPVTEEFQAPYHSHLPFAASESILLWCAPILQVAKGLGDLFRGGARGFLGKGKTLDAENALILTQKRLLFLMIGPDSLQRFAATPRVTNILHHAPGDAAAKRRILWQAGGREVREALAGLLTEESLEDLARTHFSFTIPLSHITMVGYSLDKHLLELQMDGTSLNYCFQMKSDLADLITEMTELGIPSHHRHRE